MTNLSYIRTLSFRVLPFLAIFLLCAFLIHPSTVQADQNKNSNRVSIAWEEFKKLLDLDTKNIELTWDEFKRLLAQTGSEIKVEYNLKDGMVVLSRDQFKKLLERMKTPTAKGAVPSHNYLITKAEYSGRMDKESTTFTVRFQIQIPEKERKNYINIRLLPQVVALHKITINKQPALVLNQSSWHTITIGKSGDYVVEAQFSVKSPLDKGSQVLDFPIPQTAITLVRLDVPLRGVKADLSQAKQMDVIPSGRRTRISAVLSPTTRLQLKLHRALPTAQEQKRGPAKIYAETMNLMSLEDDALRVSTKVKLNILQNKVPEIKAMVPESFSVLYVLDESGDEIRNWNTRKVKGGEMLYIPLDSKQEGDLSFTIMSEHIFSGETPEVTFTGFKIMRAIRETGYIGAEKKSTAEAEILESENGDQVDIQELPYELISMSAKPMIFGLRYLHHPFRLTLKITKHEEISTVNTVIDNASVMSVLLEEGKVVTRVIYTMRNTWKQFLELKLPVDSEMWSLTVDGKRELPSKNKEGVFLVPLVRSRTEGENIRSFDVEILYFTKAPAFGLAGNRQLPFPTADVVISKILWSVYLPVDYAFVKFGGNLEKEKIAEGLRPILGQKRVFTYKEVNGYNEVLNSMKGKSGSKMLSKRNMRLQRNLQSEFRSQAQVDTSFLNQIEQEIGFAQNIKAVQSKGSLSSGAGLSMLSIEVPTTGQLYRFAKTLVEGEPLHVSYTYIKEWVRTAVWGLLIIIALYLLFKIRSFFITAWKKLLAWVAGQKKTREYFKTQPGVRWLLAIGAVLFFFISKFLFTVFVLVFLVAWLKPQWIFRQWKKPATVKSSGSEK
jgi:hypothetical protein